MTLEILTSDLLSGVRHGFFTRRGGASSGIYAGLNCGPGSADQREIVALDRARVAEAMDVAPAALLSLHQIHSDRVVVAEDAGWTERPQADAMVTATPGLALGVLTADCAPVLLADVEAGVIGAAHAGWRGAFDGVLEETVAAMAKLGARPARIHAAVGPTISHKAYEVGPEFFDRFRDENRGWERFFTRDQSEIYQERGADGNFRLVQRGDGALLFNLPGFVLQRLRDAGVAEAGWIGACTYSEPERFYSYRRTTHAGEADYGRLISVIRL